MFTITLAHLLSRAGRLTPHEAVAIVQMLAVREVGVPALENVEIASDGTAACISSAGKPSVRDIATLLDTLLPPDTRVPPALRYTIARGMGTVEAPAFASLADFSTALQRFEALGRDHTVRNLLRRVVDDVHIPSPAETLLGIRAAAAAESAVVAPIPVVAEPVAAVVVPASVGIDTLRTSVPAPEPVRSARWGALAAAVALFASAATGYTFIKLQHTVRETPPPAAVQPAPTPPSPQPTALAPDRSPAGVSQPEQALGTAGRDVPADTPDAPAPAETPATVRAPARPPMRVMRANSGPGFSPAFSADGASLFFQTGTPRDSSSAIAMVRQGAASGGAVTRIVDDGSRNYHAQPSPDGRLIAFDSDRDGERGVYVAQADGSGAHRISGPGYAAVPTWSPDGTRLTYIRAEVDRPSVWNLWIQPAHRGPARRLTSHAFGQTWSASWFPDGRRIAYAHEDSLIVLDLDTGRARRIGSPVKGGLVRTPAVSPDGSRIVFQVFRHGAWMLNLADGRMDRVLSDPTAEEFAWAPDGRIAFHSRRDGEWAIYLLEQG
jgi:Tol biopolymer transport system component